MGDYELDDYRCPNCGYEPTHYRHCTNCEDGWIDLYEEDPMWYDDGDEEECPECHGTGVQRWCPSCGADLQIEQVDE